MKLSIAILLISILYPVIIIAQKTDNEIYEKSVKKLIKFSQEKKLDSLNILIENITNEQDLDCVQKARIYQKQASCHYKRGEFEESIQINIDSVVNIWSNCDSAKAYYLFLPVRTLIESYINQKDLYSAQKWMKYMESKPDIFKGVSERSLIKYFLIATNLNSRIGNPLEAEGYLNKAKIIIDTSKSKKLRNDKLRYYNIKGQKEFDSGNLKESLSAYENGLNYLKTPDDALLISSNIASPLLGLKDYKQARIYLENAISYANLTSNVTYKIFYNKQLIKLELAESNLENVKQLLIKNDSLINPNIHVSDYAYNENQKFILALKENKKGEAISKLNNAISVLLENKTINLNESSLDFSTDIIKNKESLKTILNNALEIYIDEYQKNKSSENHTIVKCIANGLRSLYTRNRKSFNSETAGLNNLSKTYSFYEQMIDISYEEYIKTKNNDHNNEIIKFSIENKNDILTNLFSVKKIYSKYINENEFDKLTQLESKKRQLENSISHTEGDEYKTTNQNYIDNNKKISEFKNIIHRKYPELENELKITSSDYSISYIQKHLNSDQALLDIFYGKENIYVSLITKNKSQTDRIGLDSTLQKNILQLTNDVSSYGNYNEFKNRSSLVYTSIFKNVFEKLTHENLKSLIILNDGDLHNIPFGTYWNGREHLIQNFNIGYLTHISQLNNSYKENYQSYQGYATEYSTNLNSRLNQTLNSDNLNLSQLQSNINEVSKNDSWLTKKTYINSNCTKEAFLINSKSERGVIHTALHGVEINDEKACIVFDDKTEDFILNTNEVYNLSLKNTLTILSACYSGKGKIYSGEGIRNLTRSFLYSGSKTVIASSWAASDKSNSEIMNNFLQELTAGNSLSTGLSSAKRKYLATASPAYKHPSYWGNLVLTGGNNTSGGLGNSSKFLFIGGALFLIIGGLLLRYVVAKR